jgi:hypothetical protein
VPDVDCVYDDRKIKPGMRTGAVENLTQRLVALENMFLGQGVLWQQVLDHLTSMQSPTSTSFGLTEAPSMNENLKDRTNRLKIGLSNLSDGEVGDQLGLKTSSLKRRRTTAESGQDGPRRRPPTMIDEEENVLPADDLVDNLVEIYFARIHPWIPILHVRQFRERMKVPSQRQKLTTIFHAIVSLCVRFSDDPRLGDSDGKARYSRRSRQIVILQSMESFSVENLQALVICAFDTVSNPDRLKYRSNSFTDWNRPWTVRLVDSGKHDKDC